MSTPLRDFMDEEFKAKWRAKGVKFGEPRKEPDDKGTN